MDKALQVIEGEIVVRPVGTPAQAKADFGAYQDLVKALLEPSDYQEFYEKGRKRRFKKKSGWRKLAVRFNLSVQILEVVVGHKHNKETCARILIPGEKECGCPTQYSRVTVRCTHAPSGRFSDGIGICALGEDRKFNKPDHEIPATAYTRAANRAISDMIGAGEDSAEELAGAGSAIPTNLTPEDRAELSRVYKEAPADRQEAALTLMRHDVELPEDTAPRETWIGFVSKATVEQLDEVVRMLLGPEVTGFDPDSVLLEDVAPVTE